MTELEIRKELSRIRSQIRSGNETELWIWVIPGYLACAQRPLRDHEKYGGRTPLPPAARSLVEQWVDRVIDAGFQAIISLLEEAQHDRYYVSW